MTFTEAVIQDGIHVDFSNDPLFDSDQVNNSFPCRFATVQFELYATELLMHIANRIRKEQGFKPLHAMAGIRSTSLSTITAPPRWTHAWNSSWRTAIPRITRLCIRWN